MPNLNDPFSWKDPAYQPFLERLQGNILKGHGREHTQNIFFTIVAGKAAEARGALKLIATQYVTSALKQLKDTEAFKEAKAKHEDAQAKGYRDAQANQEKAAKSPDARIESDPFVSIMLTKPGYEALEIPAENIPTDPKFQAGMRASAGNLNDDLSLWDPGFQTVAHGMILVAGETVKKVDAMTEMIHQVSEGALHFVHLQRGKGIRNSQGEGLEHFGYVDGRSQPLFLVEDIETDRKLTGTTRWNPAFSPTRLVVSDPGAFAIPDTLGAAPQPDSEAFGSYFIFRKLEEKVRDFKRAEQKLADELGLVGEERERAGALCVGRFEDGTPVTISPDPLAPTNGHVPNDFDYASDSSGGKCPFHAHIRKTNPRGSALGNDQERLTIMARRGITYEDEPREVHPDDLPEVKSFAEFEQKVEHLLPEGKLGLLFMAYNVDIGTQFEVTQRFWANDADFPKAGVGTDPVIGQPNPGSPAQQWPLEYTSGAPAVKAVDFHGHVITRGGDYFFAPSMPFLKSL